MSAHERERLAAWLDGELAPAERAAVEAHLAGCEECAALLAKLGAVDALARELPAPAPAGHFETFPARVRARIESAPRARAVTPTTRWRMPGWTWAAAAVLVLAVVTPLTLDRLDRDGAPALPEAAVVAPKAAAAPAEAREEHDEALPADGEQAPEAPAEREAGRRLEDRAGEPSPAFAAAPPPEAKLGAASRPETPSPVRGAEAPRLVGAPARESRARERRRAAPASIPEAPVLAEGEAREEALTTAPDLRRQVPTDDVVGRDAAPEAAPAEATAPRKDQRAAPPAVQAQGGLVSQEKKGVLDPEEARTFARLASGTPSSADAWRERREEWRGFVTAHPQSRQVDEARVRVIEAGLEAWRAGGDPDDLTRARADADAYLERSDARQSERVLRALENAPESPR
jgi:hypothetical protein